MNNYEDIIIRPYITEQSSEGIAEGKYTFVVDKRADKTEIAAAVEKLFNVKVLKVNTMNYSGKVKRMGYHSGPRASWKKAVVKIDTDPKPETYLDKGGKMVAVSKKYKTSIEEFGFTQ
jgi:large subunit ribosomal protein L23